MSECGKQEQHCCWIGGEECQYLKGEPYNWRCSLRELFDTWEEVYQTTAYQEIVKPQLIASDITVDCGDWPEKAGSWCTVCGYGDNPNKDEM